MRPRLATDQATTVLDPSSYRVWDLHCHLSGVDGRTPSERMAQLIAFADRMGIERLLVFMGFPWATDPTVDDLRRQNDQVLEALTHWNDRALGLAYVSPAHVETSLDEIKRCVRDGPMVGIKLWVARRCSDPAIDPIIQLTHDLNGLIFQHTWLKAEGNLPGESSPEDLVMLSKRFPGTPLICGHTGGDWERGIRIVRPYPDISIDLAGSDPTAGFVEMAVRELGAARVLYGSDAGGRSFASQLAKVLGAELTEEDRRAIFGGNLRRLLTPILSAKGLNP
ncbi:amidohydrolase family protein [Tautonia marina]|uniref:amidohydrolase family protein n=1 Tax=Tautonia marina TaxID=2653855 RepID=UPI0012605EFD|nr:amidohydrolase family protein [Tautonia marina]